MNLDTAADLAVDLMYEHGLTDAGWSFGWNRKQRAAGTTYGRERMIRLSAPVTAHQTEVAVRNTILHEIAHALVGVNHGHDAVWQRKCLAIGGNGQRCTDTTFQPDYRWRLVCDNHGEIERRLRRPNRKHTWLCAKCRTALTLEPVR